MNIQLKNILGGLLAITLLVGMYSVAVFANSYSKSIDPSSLRSFTVSAEGEVVAIPDTGQFTFSIISEGGEDLSALQEENTDLSNAVIDFLKDNGVEKEDIKTVNYSVQPRYTRYPYQLRPDGGPTPPPEIVGYSVQQTVSVKVRELSIAGTLLAGAVENGANSVSQLSFEVDDLEAVQNDARADAISKAKEKASVLADAGGFRVGDILSISEGGLFDPYPRYFDGYAISAEAGGDFSIAPSIEPGSQEIRMTVTIIYEIR